MVETSTELALIAKQPVGTTFVTVGVVVRKVDLSYALCAVAIGLDRIPTCRAGDIGQSDSIRFLFADAPIALGVGDIDYVAQGIEPLIDPPIASSIDFLVRAPVESGLAVTLGRVSPGIAEIGKGGGDSGQ